jgi:hypothetical protein
MQEILVLGNQPHTVFRDVIPNLDVLGFVHLEI